MAQKNSQTEETFRHSVFEHNEAQKTQYDITLFSLHGLSSESIDKIKEIDLITHDALYKAKALFALISLVGNVFTGGNHRLDSSQLMHCIDEAGQIGEALVYSVFTPLEELVSIAEKSEVKNA